MTRALAPSLPAAAESSNVRLLHPPNPPPPTHEQLPLDKLTPREIALIRRLLPKLAAAAAGACPILGRME